MRRAISGSKATLSMHNATLHHMLQIAATVAAVVVVASCAALPSRQPLHASVGVHVFIPSGATGYKVQPNQSIVIGPPIFLGHPAYPASLIPKHLPPQRVCLGVAIGMNGSVYWSEPIYATASCPTAGTVQPAFLAASRAAASRWRFLPTHLCTFPRGVDASKQGTNCRAEGAKVQRIAIRLAFAFTFSVISGTPRVTARSLVPHQ